MRRAHRRGRLLTAARSPIQPGFTLALGGGGARGWAHVGVWRAIEELGLRPGAVVGTSMGAIVAAGIAAGVGSDRIEAVARQTNVYRMVGKRARLALFDPRPLLDQMARELADPLIEDLPMPLGIAAYDLVSGCPTLIRSGRLVDALARSIAVPLFFPPTVDGDAVWCDAGPWESVPVSLARQMSDAPVVGVYVDVAKPAFFASRLGARYLRAVAARLDSGPPAQRLTARRYLSLLLGRMAEPVVVEPADLLIAPRLGRFMTALQFSRVGPMVERGYREALAAFEAARAASVQTGSVEERDTARAG